MKRRLIRWLAREITREQQLQMRLNPLKIRAGAIGGDKK